ncbi:MAG TPA: hypothetical protein VM933_11035 [Acidimicrobiales bacterium]|nr:hypothetical protein [Acidimicrobiales bacterium]
MFAPLLVLALVALRDDAPAPAGDVALIELRVRDVGTSRTPLLGSYSRFGYNQPGPALLWALAVPYRMVGSRYAGLELGALGIAAASFAVVLWVAWRRAGGLGAAGTGAVLAVFARGVGPGWLVDPWEPHVLAPVGLALLVLAADTAAGRAWSLPLVVAAASFVAQAWGTMLVFGVTLGALAATAVIVEAVRSRVRRRSAMRSLAVSALVVLVMWAPTIVQQLRTEPGNLVAMSRALGGGGPRFGATNAWRAVAVELGHRPPWVGFPQQLEGFSPTVDLDAAPTVPVVGLAALLALVLAVTHRWRGPVSLGAMVLVGVVAAWWSLAQLIPPLFIWIPQWLGILGASAALSVGAVAARLVPVPVRSKAVPVLLVVTAGLGVASAVEATGDWREPDLLRDAVRDVAGPAAVAVGEDRPVLVRSRLDVNQAIGPQDVAPEVLVATLERRGVDVVVDRLDANRFGPQRARPERAERELRIVSVEDEVPVGFEVVAVVDPLGAHGRRTRSRLLAEAGLPAEATLGDVLRAIAADRSLRRLADDLGPYPDLPRVALVLGPATD